MLNNKEPFANFNFGTKPTSASFELISVEINPKMMLNDYAKAYVQEFHRRNPARAEAVGLTEEELYDYFVGLIAIRIESVNGGCKAWREAKQLLIPSWIEFTLSQIGEVVDVDRGLRFIPTLNHPVEIDKLLTVSDKLRAFIPDGVSLHKDAFPRGTEGDPETMSMAIIGQYVYSQSKDAHPIASYVASFLGFKLMEEATFKMLYRVRYDDISFIKSMLLREESVF